MYEHNTDCKRPLVRHDLADRMTGIEVKAYSVTSEVPDDLFDERGHAARRVLTTADNRE
jgi:hypothetical protein